MKRALEGWLASLGEAVVRVVSNGVRDSVEFAVAAATGSRAFMVEVKGSDSIAGLQRAAAQLLRLPRVPGQVPLLVVPYMGPQAHAWARSKQVSWADLSGNADIRAPNLRVFVEGNANRYAQSGRPASPFAPKYARVSRVLLTDTDRWWRQRDLCMENVLSDATVSRAVGHLESADLLETNSEGAVRARAPSVLLNAWAQRYSFADHRVHKFQTVARTGHAALQSLATKLSATSTTWAAWGWRARSCGRGSPTFGSPRCSSKSSRATPSPSASTLSSAARTCGSWCRETRVCSTTRRSRACGVRPPCRSTSTSRASPSAPERWRPTCAPSCFSGGHAGEQAHHGSGLPTRDGHRSPRALFPKPSEPYTVTVTSAIKKVLEDALALPREERATIVEVLSESLATERVELSPTWTAEVNRRLAEVESGTVRPIPWDEAEARIKRSLGLP